MVLLNTPSLCRRSMEVKSPTISETSILYSRNCAPIMLISHEGVKIYSVQRLINLQRLDLLYYNDTPLSLGMSEV